MSDRSSPSPVSPGEYDSENNGNDTGVVVGDQESDGAEDSDVEFDDDEEDSDVDLDDDEEDSDDADVDLLVRKVESEFLDLLDKLVGKVEQQQDIVLHTSSSQGVKVLRVISSSKRDLKDEGTQTDSLSSSLTVSQPLQDDTSIREEIDFLRQARESLVLQRKDLADIVKAKNKSSENADHEQLKVYELEEAIEAIDHVVEFKNEALCGKEIIWSNCRAPGEHEADLVTRLSKLSTLDLQKLLCRYFRKVTEFRFSAKDLEKRYEEKEKQNKNLKKQLRDYEKLYELQADECEKRVRSLLQLEGKHPSDKALMDREMLEERIFEYQKQQIDLQRCLKDLLENVKFPGASEQKIPGILEKLSRLQISNQHTRKYDEGYRSKHGHSSNHRNGSAKIPSSSRAHKSRVLSEFSDSRRVADDDKYSYKRRLGIADPVSAQQELIHRLRPHEMEALQLRRHHASTPLPSSQPIVKRTKNQITIENL